MSRREVEPLTINHRQMAEAHLRLSLKGFPNCSGQAGGPDLEGYLMQQGMTREEAQIEIVDAFKGPYLKGE